MNDGLRESRLAAESFSFGREYRENGVQTEMVGRESFVLEEKIGKIVFREKNRNGKMRESGLAHQGH